MCFHFTVCLFVFYIMSPPTVSHFSFVFSLLSCFQIPRELEEFTHLIPGVQQHDIIGGQISLGEVARNFLDLRERTGSGKKMQ